MSFTMSVLVCVCFVLKYQSVKELLRAHVCHVDLYILLPTLNKIYLLTYLLTNYEVLVSSIYFCQHSFKRAVTNQGKHMLIVRLGYL